MPAKGNSVPVDPIYCLIVEEDRFMASYIKEAVVHFISPAFPLQVKIAKDGEEALEILASGSSVDILITDLIIPKISGEELVRKVRKILPQTIVIALTGYASISDAVAILKEGVFDYLPKPLDHERFRDTLNRAVEQIKILRHKEILSDLSQLWSISHFLGKNLNPHRVLKEVLEEAIKAIRDVT